MIPKSLIQQYTDNNGQISGSIRIQTSNLVDRITEIPKTYNLVSSDEAGELFIQECPVEWKALYNQKGRPNQPEILNETRFYPSDTSAIVDTRTNENIFDADGRYKLSLQKDGNLVIYRLSDLQVFWASNSAVANPQPEDNYQLIFQKDGNLVIYKINSNGERLGVGWALGKTQVAPRTNNSHQNTVHGFFIFQKDGNFVLYYPSTIHRKIIEPIVATESDNKVSNAFGTLR